MMTHNEVKTLLDEIYQQEVYIHQIPGVTLFEIGDESIIYDKHRGFIFSEYSFTRKINSIDDCNKVRAELRRYTERRELLERTLVGECEYQTERNFEHIEYIANKVLNYKGLYLSIFLKGDNFEPVDDWYGFFKRIEQDVSGREYAVFLKNSQYDYIDFFKNSNSMTRYSIDKLTYENLK